jgi:predicted RNA-binding protein
MRKKELPEKQTMENNGEEKMDEEIHPQEKTIVKNANAAGLGAIVRSGEELDKGPAPPENY